MKKLSLIKIFFKLIFILLLNFSIRAQSFADKSFYLVDSLNLNELTKTNRKSLDHILILYHKEKKDDTTKLAFLSQIIDENYYNEVGYKYHLLQKQLVEKKLSKNLYKTERKKYLIYLVKVLCNDGFFSSGKGDINAELKSYQKALKIQIGLGEKKGVDILLNNIAAVYFRKGNKPEALKYFKKSLKISEDLKDKKSMASTYKNIGSVFLSQDKPAEGLYYLNKSLKTCQELNDKNGLLETFYEIGYLFYKQGKMEKALDNFFKSLKISEEIKDKKSIAEAYNRIGMVYFELKFIKKSSEYYHKSLKIYEETRDENNIASTLINLALLSPIKDRNLAYFYKALKIFRKFGEKYEESIVLSHIANTYYNKGENTKALDYTYKALKMAELLGNKELIINMSTQLGNIALKMSNLNKAKIYGIKSLAIAKEIAYKDLEGKAAHLLSKIYKKQGDYKKGWEMYELYISKRDSVLNEETKTKSLEQEFKYQTEKKEQKLALISEKNKVQSLQIKQNKIWNYSLGGGFLFVGSIFILIILRQKAITGRKNAEFARKKVELEQQILRSQMNPHFLFNSLNNIQAIYVEGKTDLATEYMSNFSLLLRKILDNSSKESIPIDEELEMLTLYLELEKIGLEQEISYNLHIDEEINRQYEIAPLIIQPFVENSIKHGIRPTLKKGNIMIHLSSIDQNLIQCVIEDNGIGYNTSLKNKKTNHQSKGIQISLDRLGIKNGIKIEEIKSGGTRVSIIIPIKI